MAWPLVPLSDLCSQHRAAASASDDLPYIAMDQVEGNTGEIRLEAGSRSGNGDGTTFKFDARHVLYGKLRPYLNKVATPDFNGKCSTELVPLLPHEGTNRRFLAYVLRRDETIKTVMTAAVGARMPRASMDVLLAMRVPLPPLAEQQRIVEILDRAAAIQRLRRAAEEKAREIIPALFVDMFGDPATNPKGWDEKTVDELCTLVRGSSPRPQGDARYFNGPVPRLMIADITRDGVYVTPQIDSLTELGATKSRPMTKGSVVMAVSGAVGLPAILAIDCCIHDGFVGFRNLSDQITARYFYWHLVARRQRSDGEAVGAIFRNITTDQIRAWKVPVPPSALQRKFETIMDAADAATTASSAASDVAVKVAASLGQSLLG
jgi:restriction endonuclease S subunit